MDSPHDDLTTKWGTVGEIGALIGTAFASALAYFRARKWRKDQENEDPDRENQKHLSLRSLDKRIKDHDNRLDQIDLQLLEMCRESDQNHRELMRQLKRIVGNEST